jgi:hypothetical protein
MACPMSCPSSTTCCAARTCPRSASARWRTTTSCSAASAPSILQNRQLQAALQAELERLRHRPAHLPRQPQLAAVRHRRRSAPDAAGWREEVPDLRHQRLQLLLRMPPVPRGYPEGAGGAGPRAPASDKIRVYYNHPLFIEVTAPPLEAGLRPAARRAARGRGHAVHRAQHSAAMAAGCDYAAQLQEAARLTAEAAGIRAGSWCTRAAAGRPPSPGWSRMWATPSAPCTREGVPAVILVPIGFISDHMEVLYDLDREARELCQELGLPGARLHPGHASAVRADDRRADPAERAMEPRRLRPAGRRGARSAGPVAGAARPTTTCAPPKTCCPSGMDGRRRTRAVPGSSRLTPRPAQEDDAIDFRRFQPRAPEAARALGMGGAGRDRAVEHDLDRAPDLRLQAATVTPPVGPASGVAPLLLHGQRDCPPAWRRACAARANT